MRTAPGNSLEVVIVPAHYQEACWGSVDDRFWGVAIYLLQLCWGSRVQNPFGPVPYQSLCSRARLGHAKGTQC